MNLLCLVGGQIWPNFLPILDLRPQKVAFLTSADTSGSYNKSIVSLHDTAQKMGCNFETEIINTSEENPTLVNALEALGPHAFDLVNLTGGTKPMSLAAFQHALLAAAQHQILHQDADHFFLTNLDPLIDNADELRSLANQNFKLLEGIWFELALYEHLKSKTAFTDIQWSVEADSPDARSCGETDLVAFNKNSLNLHFISCKTAGPLSPLDHIQGLRQRASKEGGDFSKAELWIFAPKDLDQRTTLQSHCAAQRVSLHVLSEELTAETTPQ